jgi:hypothetical protein
MDANTMVLERTFRSTLMPSTQCSEHDYWFFESDSQSST